MGRLILYLTFFFVLVSCMGGKSKISGDHDPLNSDDDIDQAQVADPIESEFLVAVYGVKNDGTSKATIQVVVKDNAGDPIQGKIVTLTSSRGALDTITPTSATSDAAGEVEFEITSLTTGKPELTANVTTDSIEISHNPKLRFLSEDPYYYFWADVANGEEPSENNPSGDITWESVGTAVSMTANLFNFALDSSLASSRWAGDGSNSITSANDGQHRLIFDGTNDYVNLGTGLDALTEFSSDAWIRPDAFTRGKTIFSNADETTRGLTLRQAWDGQGKLSLHAGKSYAEVILDDLPVQYWRLGETSGTTYYGSTATSGMNATEIAGITKNVAGALANDSNASLTFSRPTTNNGALTVVDNSLLDDTNAFSLEAWLYPTGDCNTAICGIIAKRLNTNSQESYGLFMQSGNLSFRIGNAAGNQLTLTSPFTLSNWYHVVATFDGSAADTGISPSVNHKVKLYINGSFVISRIQTGTTSIPNSASPLSIGHLTGNTSSGWNGQIDEVAYYNYALTATQVSAHYSARTRHAVHSSGVLTANTWNHIGTGFTAATGELSISLNGTSVSKTLASSVISNSGQDMLVGATEDDNVLSHFWSGEISEIRFFDESLTASEINSCRTSSSADYP